MKLHNDIFYLILRLMAPSVAATCIKRSKNEAVNLRLTAVLEKPSPKSIATTFAVFRKYCKIEQRRAFPKIVAANTAFRAGNVRKMALSSWTALSHAQVTLSSASSDFSRIKWTFVISSTKLILAGTVFGSSMLATIGSSHIFTSFVGLKMLMTHSPKSQGWR